MVHITVERAHTLGKKGAHARAEKLTQKLKEQYNMQQSWSGDTLNLKCPGIKGSVLVADHSLRIDVELGLFMSAMGGIIKSEIEKALDKALA